MGGGTTLRQKEQVRIWLESIGLTYAVPAFLAHSVTTPAKVAALTLEDFECLGVKDSGERKKLFYLVQRIKLAVDSKKKKKQKDQRRRGSSDSGSSRSTTSRGSPAAEGAGRPIEDVRAPQQEDEFRPAGDGDTDRCDASTAEQPFHVLRRAPLGHSPVSSATASKAWPATTELTEEALKDRPRNGNSSSSSSSNRRRRRDGKVRKEEETESVTGSSSSQSSPSRRRLAPAVADDSQTPTSTRTLAVSPIFGQEQQRPVEHPKATPSSGTAQAAAVSTPNSGNHRRDRLRRRSAQSQAVLQRVNSRNSMGNKTPPGSTEERSGLGLCTPPIHSSDHQAARTMNTTRGSSSSRRGEGGKRDKALALASASPPSSRLGGASAPASSPTHSLASAISSFSSAPTERVSSSSRRPSLSKQQPRQQHHRASTASAVVSPLRLSVGALGSEADSINDAGSSRGSDYMSHSRLVRKPLTPRKDPSSSSGMSASKKSRSSPDDSSIGRAGGGAGGHQQQHRRAKTAGAFLKKDSSRRITSSSSSRSGPKGTTRAGGRGESGQQQRQQQTLNAKERAAHAVIAAHQRSFQLDLETVSKEFALAGNRQDSCMESSDHLASGSGQAEDGDAFVFRRERYEDVCEYIATVTAMNEERKTLYAALRGELDRLLLVREGSSLKDGLPAGS